jgi:hypothetical protein
MLEIWYDLQRESPSDARWFLETARIWSLRGHYDRAELDFQQAAFLSSHRADTYLIAGRILLEAHVPRLAAKKAVEALPFVKRRSQQGEALHLLEASGHLLQAGELRRLTLERPWPVLRGALRQTPRR